MYEYKKTLIGSLTWTNGRSITHHMGSLSMVHAESALIINLPFQKWCVFSEVLASVQT